MDNNVFHFKGVQDAETVYMAALSALPWVNCDTLTLNEATITVEREEFIEAFQTFVDTHFSDYRSEE